LRFAVEDSQRPFKIDLTASPDLRFLTRELLDSQLDPVQQERQKQQALTAALTRGDFAVLGEKAAPVTITVFADFQCPYCAEASDVLMKNILPAEGGNTRLVFRHFPLAMHPWARPAAEAAACAHEQGDRYFWSFHNYIFEHQREITPDNLRPKLDAYGTALQGFDPADFTACLDQKRTAAKVEQDVALGTEVGVRGTPTLFINGQLMSGVQPEQIRTYIREMTDRAKN
jgi:protein-disulfide isomerase